MSGRPAGFCLVGVGGHARTKLIPAIAANGQTLRGMVSRQSPDTLPPAPVYPSIEAAAAALPGDTVFLIASPPHAHFGQAIAALGGGRDVLVEKPAFLTADEARSAMSEVARHNAVLVEGFMHRHTRLFRRLREAWPAMRADVAAIRIAFVVPSLPGATFRQSQEIGASILYDIGCYALSLLTDLGLPLDGLAVAGLERPGTAAELLHLSGRAGGLETSISIGVGPAYENAVALELYDGTALLHAPFFYGRPGERTITTTRPDGTAEVETIADDNGFEAMLAVPREEWAASQPARMRDLIAVTACLERLGVELLSHRRDCPPSRPV
jgi:predicted dehydrogenase